MLHIHILNGPICSKELDLGALYNPLMHFKKVNHAKFVAFSLSFKHCKYYCTVNIAHQTLSNLKK